MKKIHFEFLEPHPERCELQKSPEKEPVPSSSSPAQSFGESQNMDFKDLWKQLHFFLEQLGTYIRLKWFYWLPKRIRIPWFKLFVSFMLIYLFTQRNVVFQIQWGNLSDSPQTSALQVVDHSQSPPTPPPEPDKGQAAAAAATAAAAAKSTAPWLIKEAGDTEKDKRYKAYIRRFEKVARVEMEKFSIPASICMAQGLLESNGGTSLLATRNNNHFGIKCFSKSCKKGHCSNFSDDSHKDFFRIYGSAWESWRAHSKLLANGKYKVLKKHGKDYKAWARGLKRLGYATDPNYANNLIRIIRKYELYRLDQ